MARLSKDDEYDIESAFRVFDREGDGMIKVQELKVKALLGKSIYFWKKYIEFVFFCFVHVKVEIYLTTPSTVLACYGKGKLLKK